MMRTYQISSVEAWAKTLGPVLLTPFLVLGIGGALFSYTDQQGLHFFWIVFGGVGVLVHFTAYFLFGLPIYLFFWEQFKALWTWKIGVPVGALLGGIVICLPYTWIADGSSTFNELSVTFVLGSFYGIITAVGAIHSRRKNLK